MCCTEKKKIAIECKKLTKTYPVKNNIFKQINSLLRNKSLNNYVYALKDIDLTLYEGEILGIIGINGSGKTTLSRIIAGLCKQSSGEMICNGDVNMLSAGSALNEYMTGIENIRYKCTIMGLDRRQTQRILPKIIVFSDLGEYIHRPLRTYSSGMKARLGFSIAVFALPDILIVDEALSVGDVGFAAKCADKIRELKKQKRTVIYVSHAVEQMQNFCDRVIWLHNGVKIAEDIPERLIMPYCGFARDYNEMTSDERKNLVIDVDDYQKRILPSDIYNMKKEELHV